MERLKQLFSALVIYRHNMNILHWKSKGCHFDGLHKLFSDYGDKFNNLIDEVAEIMLIEGENPLCFKHCFETASEDTRDHLILTGGENYDSENSAIAVEKMFEGTKVSKVNTMNLEGKTKRRGRTVGKTAKRKKAIVQLTADSKDIEIFQGL